MGSLFRYWDRQNPSATRPSITLGTVEDYPTQADARRAAEGLRLEINHGLPMREAVTFQGLIDRYVSEEIERGELAHTTREPDLNRINKHISPTPHAEMSWVRVTGYQSSYCGVHRAWIVKRPLTTQIWYATTRPKARLSSPDAIPSLRETLERLPATILSVEAILIVIVIIPAMVPTPNTRR